MTVATLLLPSRARFAGHALPGAIARTLGRADRSQPGQPGERAQLLRHFALLPRGWPVAALTRQLDAGDAPLSAWLRADPVYVRPDINGARLLAHDQAMQLGSEDVEALLPALRPLFGDTGFTIDAPTPGRWYLRLPREAKLPVLAAPADAVSSAPSAVSALPVLFASGPTGLVGALSPALPVLPAMAGRDTR